MELRQTTSDDAWLTVALETDERAMARLGGPNTVDQARAAHERKVAGAERGEYWSFVIVPEPDSPGVGTIGLWPSTWADEAISETGWMVLPDHQGRGYASAALGLLLERARADGRWGDIHAFPGVDNAPSNALCRKFGFDEIETVDVDYRERILRCNHWVLRADRGPTGESG